MLAAYSYLFFPRVTSIGRYPEHRTLQSMYSELDFFQHTHRSFLLRNSLFMETPPYSYPTQPYNTINALFSSAMYVCTCTYKISPFAII